MLLRRWEVRSALIGTGHLARRFLFRGLSGAELAERPPLIRLQRSNWRGKAISQHHPRSELEKPPRYGGVWHAVAGVVLDRGGVLELRRPTVSDDDLLGALAQARLEELRRKYS